MSASPPPLTPQATAPASFGTTLAGAPTPNLWRRMACWLYEGMLMFGVVFIAGYLFGTLSQTRNAMDNRHALQAFLFVRHRSQLLFYSKRRPVHAGIKGFSHASSPPTQFHDNGTRLTTETT